MGLNPIILHHPTTPSPSHPTKQKIKVRDKLICCCSAVRLETYRHICFALANCSFFFFFFQWHCLHTHTPFPSPRKTKINCCFQQSDWESADRQTCFAQANCFLHVRYRACLAVVIHFSCKPQSEQQRLP